MTKILMNLQKYFRELHTNYLFKSIVIMSFITL